MSGISDKEGKDQRLPEWTWRAILFAVLYLYASFGSTLRHNLAQNVGQNPPMLIVIYFDLCIDAAAYGDVGDFARFTGDFQNQILLRLDRGIEANDIIRFGTIKLQRLRSGSFLKLERQHAHADEIRAMDALKALGNDNFYAELICALGRPVTRRTRAVFLACNN